MWKICAVLVVYSKIINSQDLASSVDIKTLSELPIDKLLRVKNSFDIDTGDTQASTSNNEDQDSNLNGALPLTRVKNKLRPYKRGDWYDVYNKSDNKKSVQSIFQVSVTTLAFLAFGGYLLCLVVQSLKQKEGYKVVFVPVSSTTAAPVTLIVLRNRRRRRRRPLRLRKPIREKREIDDTSKSPHVDMTPFVDPERMLSALVTLSEAYTQYHTVDYKKFNETRHEI